jgi:gluconate 5-dehydrogenase
MVDLPSASRGGLARFSLAGRRALVVGASRGIGLAIARHLAEAGAQVTLAARSADALAARVDELRSGGLAADVLVLDATDRDAVAFAARGMPALDVLACVAGTNLRRPFLDFSWPEVEALLETNLHAVLHVTREFGRPMVDRSSGGKVILVGSLAVGLGLPGISIYAATKGALASLTRSLAAEWAAAGIQVNCIAPGFVLTDLNRRMWQDPAMSAWLAGSQANPRLGTPDDVAPLAVFLASSASDYVTGQVLAVDGGLTVTAMWPFSGER